MHPTAVFYGIAGCVTHFEVLNFPGQLLLPVNSSKRFISFLN